jgi:hypothetical protein
MVVNERGIGDSKVIECELGHAGYRRITEIFVITPEAYALLTQPTIAHFYPFINKFEISRLPEPRMDVLMLNKK